MNIEFKANSIVCLIGPSNCGKSFLANEIRSQLSKPDKLWPHKIPKISIISSDDLRRELLIEDLDKTDTRMMPVSEQAFELLEAKVRAYSTYPVNHDLIIIDSTGLNPIFRDRMRQIAKENHYNFDFCLFTYKNKEDYYTFCGDSKWLTDIHLKKFNQELSNIGECNQKIKILRRESVSVSITRHNNYISGSSFIFGDSHGCYDEVISLFKEAGYTIENDKITYSPYENTICVGDYIDKGPKVKELVNFLYNNRDIIKIVSANHENFVTGYWDQKFEASKALIDQYFTSVYIEDQIFRTQLRTLYSESHPFISHDEFIVTHAPCHKKFLGKLDSVSLKQQRSFRKIDDPIELMNNLSFLIQEDQRNFPTHVWGHIPFNKTVRGKSYLGIDTNAVAGGDLTGVIFDNTISYIKVKCPKYIESTPFSWYIKKNYKITDLPKRAYRIAKQYLKNELQFISGTMCPVDKKNTLEDLDWGLDYYSKYCDSIVLQPKMMGSRANIYLYNDPEKCFVVTRNGWKRTDIKIDYQYWIDFFKQDFENGLVCRILDCELMPWSVLGEGLIKDSFQSIYLLAEQELRESDGFNEAIEKLLSVEIDHKLSKKELVAKYGNQINTLRNNLSTIRSIYSKEEELKHLEDYAFQMNLFSRQEDPYIVPFDILKDIYENKSVLRIWESNKLKWEQLGQGNRCICVSPKDKEVIRGFFDYLVSENYEGIVIKPEFYSSDFAPFLKVRNPEYLRVVYGFDYLQEKKYQKLIDKKRINKKLFDSIKEFNLGVRMLEGDNSAMLEFLMEEQDTDPRL